jgi:hypothetical protein
MLFIINSLAKIMQGEKRGFSGKVMSLTTLLNLKTQERDYNTDDLSGTVSSESALAALAAHYHGASVHPGTGNDAEFVALERGWRQLSDDPALVSDNTRLGGVVVGNDKSAFAGSEWGGSAGG